MISTRTGWIGGEGDHPTEEDDGEIDIDKNRRETAGKDVFKVKVKKIGGAKACTRTRR